MILPIFTIKKYQHMRPSFFFVAIAVVFTLWACGNKTDKQAATEKTLPDYFSEISAMDTVRFEVFPDGDTSGTIRIPTSLFFRKMPTKLMNEILYFDNSEPLRVYGRGRFSISEGKKALWVDMRQNWYQHQSLFIYDQALDTILSRITLAAFYGGEGGQIINGSYWFDQDGDGDKDLVQREIEHWLDTRGAEPADRFTHTVGVFAWENGQFSPAAVADSAALIAAFPIDPLMGQ